VKLMHRSKYFFGLTALTAGILGGGTLAATAYAATPSCGPSCVDVFSDQFGDGVTGHPGFLMDSAKQGVATGTSIILFRESNHDPAEDFVFENQGTVSDFAQAGLVSPMTSLHYGCIAGTVAFPTCVFGTDESDGNANLDAYEIEYTPFGAATGECAGLAATPVAGEKVTLQPCGVSGRTVWIVDAFDGSGGPEQFGDSNSFGESTGTEDGVPLINGANTNFSHPFVLTYPDGYPTDQPRPVLQVTNLTGFFRGIFPDNTTATMDVSSSQLWDALTGTVQR